MRGALRSVMIGATVGALALGSAWAGASLAPVGSAGDGGLSGGPHDGLLDELSDGLDAPAPGRADERAAGRGGSAGRGPGHGGGQGGGGHGGGDHGPISGGDRLPDGWFRAGSATASLVPPEDRWVQGADCAGGLAPEQLYTPFTPDGCLITFDMRWADGVDEANPIAVRAAAIGNGETAVVYAAMDLVGYMASYPLTGCGDCGLAQIADDLADELDLPAQNLVFASTHTHAAPTTIAEGPVWYYEHVRDQVKQAVRDAVADAAATAPVRLETGAVAAKAFNTDRRIVNRAIPDYELAWLRAFVPEERRGAGERTVVTIGNFAVHPTVRAGNAQLHSGMVGPFERHLAEQLGGGALFFPSGLGDQRLDRGFGVNGMGVGLADAIAGDVARGGHVLTTNDIEVAHGVVDIPVENQFFAAALAAGYAVRDVTPPFGGGPMTVSVTKGGANRPVCTQAGALHVTGPVSAVRLGARPPEGKRQLGDEFALPVETDNVVLVQAPGELFASIGLIVKDALSRTDNVLVLSMADDTLGYMAPEDQYDVLASQGLGLANNATNLGNYEEALSLGRCSGEIVTQAMLELGQQLGALGEGESP